MRYAARKDANQAPIVEALRSAGAYVWDLGLPVDILVGYKGHTVLMELKDGNKKKLTKLQEDFFLKWPGGTLCRVNDVEGALRVLEVISAKQE